MILISMVAAGMSIGSDGKSILYVILGTNIGTCITAVLASIGTNRSAKRTTIIHLMFNLIGTCIFTIVCLAFPLEEVVAGLTPNNVPAQIANMHTTFNIATTLLLLPFGNYMAKLAVRILPDEEEKERVNEEDIDIIVLAGFMKILSGDFTNTFENRIINVHPSLIPSFCGEGFYGLKVHEAALAYGVKVTGATVHFVNEIADGGKIIMQKAVKIKEKDTPEVLQKRVMEEAEWKILPASLELVCKMIIKGDIQ